MNVEQKRKLLERIQLVESQLEELKQVRVDLLKNGYQSATIAAGGGSKSYTRLDVGKITATIKVLSKELKQLKAMLNTGSTNTFIPHTVTVIYS